MAIRNNGQQNNGYAIELDVGDAQRLMIAAQTCQRLYIQGGVWYKFDHTNDTAPNPQPIVNGVYVPPFQVRYMKVEGSNTTVKHDLANGGMRWTSEQYAANIMHRLHITQVWLDNAQSETTADAVTLYG